MSGPARPPDEFSGAILEAARIARIGVGITAVEASGARNLWFNDVAVEILGWPIEELMRNPTLAVIAPEELPHVAERLAARQRGEPLDPAFETIVLRQDGTRVPVRVAISHLELDGQRTSVSFFADISARHAAEAALRSSEARFRSVIESAPDAIVISRRGLILYANPAAARLLGFSSASAMDGVQLGDLLEPDDARAMGERMHRMIETGETFSPREYRARARDGRRVVVEITSHVIEYDGAPAILGFGRDVTERIRMQEQLARADRLAALGTLAAGVAHEINNPLAFVTLGIDSLETLIERAIPEPAMRAEARARLEPLRTGAARVAEIVRDLRAFSRNEEDSEKESAVEIDVGSVVQAAVRIAAHELRHRAAVEMVVEDRLRALGQPGRLEQVLVNLLVNASQSFEDGRAGARVLVRCAAHGDRVAIEVEDNGAGIAPEILGRVFDPFFTTKPAGVGTGLGLAICHSIVTRMGGTIALESALGRGTKARIELPAAPAGPPRQHPPSRSEAAAGRRLRVLIVDDEPALLRMLAALLSPHHDVATAGDGAEALARLESERFDVVLCDVTMPRMGGRELYERVREAQHELASRFVFMTGGALDESTDQWLSSIEEPRLWKPFATQAVLDALRRAGEA